MSDSSPPKIIIKHRYTGAVLYEYQPTDEQQESGLAMRAALETATKDGANLREAYLEGAYLEGAYLEGAYLEGANLCGANLCGANLDWANLDWANLEGANLDGAKLRGAKLRGANLREAYLEVANLEGANLDGANLGGAYLDGAYLRGAYLDGANLGGAYLDGAYLRGAYLDGANLDGKTLIGKRPVFTLGPIGSRCDSFTAYLTDKGIYLRAGCFFGSVAEFTDRLERAHGTSEHGQEYRAALTLIECHARLWTHDASASQAEATTETAES